MKVLPGSTILTSDPDDLRALLTDQPSIEVQVIWERRLESTALPVRGDSAGADARRVRRRTAHHDRALARRTRAAVWLVRV